LLEGDNNTKYFQLIANGKYRKNQIYKLEDGGNIIHEDANLMQYITTYYKGVFGKPDDNTFSLDESKISDIPHVGEQENEILFFPFQEEEVKLAILQMEHNKAPRPDGFQPEFD
jgi:hypothetical protein